MIESLSPVKSSRLHLKPQLCPLAAEGLQSNHFTLWASDNTTFLAELIWKFNKTMCTEANGILYGMQQAPQQVSSPSFLSFIFPEGTLFSYF